jgi:predicted unusual protein kinase regulating ubiquinone biosynthesis (AarF/ABC1/UbiB family)
MVRGGRCGVTAGLMAVDYLRVKEITEDVHLRASQRMYNCFCKNGGPYIKLGQMVGQLD